MPGWWLASGDQRRLTGSGSAFETVFVKMCYTNGRVHFTHFTVSRSIAVTGLVVTRAVSESAELLVDLLDVKEYRDFEINLGD